MRCRRRYPCGTPALSTQEADLAAVSAFMSKRNAAMDANAADEQRAKRPRPARTEAVREGGSTGCIRTADAAGLSFDEPPQFALLSCFDKRDELIEIDTSVLAPFNCRLYAAIKHDRPYLDQAGRHFWRTNMTRAMLQTFVRSLEHGTLSLSKNVSVAEAMTTFEYENVQIGVPSERMAEVAMLRNPPAGAAFAKRDERVSEQVLRTSELVAHAIARWPRLEASLDAALSGLPVTCTCTATRAWIRVSRKPQIFIDKGDASSSLARNWPKWIETMLQCFGKLHAKLVRDRVVGDKDRDAEAFGALHSAVQGDQLSFLMTCAFDRPRYAQDKHARREQLKSEVFANEIREAILGAPLVNKPEPTESERYARACISLAESIVYDAPNIASMYSGTCCDENGKSPERAQLAKSLAQRGVKVVRWSEDEKCPPRPLDFPPAWADASQHASCAVLLEFTGR
mgnify:CR=1 FL=1